MKFKCKRCQDSGIRPRGKYDLVRCECAQTVHQRRTFAFCYFNATRIGRYKRRIGSQRLTAEEAALALSRMNAYARFFGFRSLAAMLKAPVRKADGYGLAGFAVESWSKKVARLVDLAAGQNDAKATKDQSARRAA